MVVVVVVEAMIISKIVHTDDANLNADNDNDDDDCFIKSTHSDARNNTFEDRNNIKKQQRRR